MISVKQTNSFKLQIKRSAPDHQGLTPKFLDLADSSPNSYNEEIVPRRVDDSTPHIEELLHIDNTSLDPFYVRDQNSTNVQKETHTLKTDFISDRYLESTESLSYLHDRSNFDANSYLTSNTETVDAANVNNDEFTHRIHKRSNIEVNACEEVGDSDRRDAHFGIWSISDGFDDENNKMENSIERISNIDNHAFNEQSDRNVDMSTMNSNKWVVEQIPLKSRRSFMENRNVLSLKSSSTHILKQKPQSQGKDKAKITDLNQKSSAPIQKVINIKEEDLKKNWTSSEEVDETNMTESTTETITTTSTVETLTTADPREKLIDLKQKVKEITKQAKARGDKSDKNNQRKEKGKKKEKTSTERVQTTKATKKKAKSKDGKPKEKSKEGKTPGGKKQQKKPAKEGKEEKFKEGRSKFKDKDKIKFIERNEERLIESKKNSSKEVRIKSWDECSSEGDYLIFYDGATQTDPVLFKYCGNGE